MQHGTAERGFGKFGSVHGRWNLRVSPIQSAWGWIVFIIRDSFSGCVLRLVTGGTLRVGPALASGGNPPIDSFKQSSDILVEWLARRPRIVRPDGGTTTEAAVMAAHEFGIYHET